MKEGWPTIEPTNIRAVLRLVRKLYGRTPTIAFGRERFGIEATRSILGHEEVRTAQIYAEEDRSRGVEIMRSIG